MHFRSGNKFPLADFISDSLDEIGRKREIQYRPEAVLALELLKSNPGGLAKLERIAGVGQESKFVEDRGRNQPIGFGQSLVDDRHCIQNVFISVGKVEQQVRITG